VRLEELVDDFRQPLVVGVLKNNVAPGQARIGDARNAIRVILRAPGGETVDAGD
jgi:hypothetical protein